MSPGDRRAESARLSWIRRYRAPVALLGATAVLAVVAQTPPGRSVLQLTGMIKPAPGYSSLFFPSVQQFPSGLLDGEDSFPVTFAIGNPAQQSRDYRWSIQTVDQGKIATIDSGTASVAAGSVNVVRQTVQASCSGKMKVIVRLTAPGEPDDAIDFLTTCTQDNSGRNVSTSAGGPSTGPAKSSSKGAGSTSGAAGL